MTSLSQYGAVLDGCCLHVQNHFLLCQTCYML